MCCLFQKQARIPTVHLRAKFVAFLINRRYTQMFESDLKLSNISDSSLRKPKVFALQILQRYLTKEGRVRKFFHCLYG